MPEIQCTSQRRQQARTIYMYFSELLSLPNFRILPCTLCVCILPCIYMYVYTGAYEPPEGRTPLRAAHKLLVYIILYSGKFSRVHIFVNSPVELPAEIFAFFNFHTCLTWDHTQILVEPYTRTPPWDPGGYMYIAV